MIATWVALSTAVAAGQGPPPVEVQAGQTLYALDEAVADALSGPLVFIGKGGWPGLFKRLSCAYRNDRVIVVDTYCTEREGNSFELKVYSPTRGLVAIYAEAKAPISTLKRSEYLTFTSTTFPPPAPTILPMTLGMSYEALIAYVNAHTRLGLRICSGGMTGQRPLGCQKALAAYEPEFVSRNAPFLSEPGDSWQRLVRQLVAQRKRNGAVITDWNRLAWGEAHAYTQEIRLYEYHLKHYGNADGIFAPVIATPSSGLLLVGTKAGEPIVIRLGAAGQVLWQRSLRRQGFQEFEGGSAVATSDGGFVIFVLAYVNSKEGAATRLVKLNSDGKVQWDWISRRGDRTKPPFAEVLQQTPRGTFLMTGHVYVLADHQKDSAHNRELHVWTGEVDATGKLLRDEIGPIRQADPNAKKN
jgi:hypothetical protein